MTAQERKALATKAAHARWDVERVVVATHEGDAEIATLTLSCAVLEDGRRIFSERGLSEAFTHVRSGTEFKKRAAQPESERLPVFLNVTVAAFLPPQVRAALAAPIRFRHKDNNFGVPAWGIEATLLPEICDAYLQARDAGVLKDAVSMRKAAAAEKLIRALAKVAIVALIDEATGYQDDRNKDELQRLLAAYVSEEFRPWQSVFPPTFYREMFRLRKVAMADVRKRPQYFGNLTNNVVYERLLPGMRPRLAAVNPVNENGRRARKNHQHFEDIGLKHLQDHITGVVMLMKSSKNWDEFMQRLDAAVPRQLDR